ncbi:putative FAD-binding domain-containing protein [Seiridium cardinale]
MGSYFSASSTERPMHVLIAGGETRRHGWALTLHWVLDALERTIGKERAAKLQKAVVDSSLKKDAGNFLFLNAETCETRYKIPPSKRRLRLHRQKLRDVLTDGLNIQEGKDLVRVEEIEGGVRAHFQDGTSVDGTILIGADGNNSNVRKFLMPEHHELNRLPVHLVGVVRHFTPEQAAPVRALDPLLFQALHPKTQNYLWYSVQECFTEPDGRLSFDCLVIISWIMKDPVSDAIPKTNPERIAKMKERAKEFAEPLRSIVMDIPDDMDYTTPLRLGDFPCRDWDNRNGQVTLAGDAAHAMTMYRGEGANHGILDAALLVDELKRIHKGEIDQKAAINLYEAEMRPRTHEAVLKSRAAALVAHEWDQITIDSPIVGARTAPLTAFK